MEVLLMLINPEQKIYSLGLMSGTSLDGIDVALVAHQNNHHQLVDFKSYPIKDELKSLLLKLASNEQTTISEVSNVNAMLGDAYVEAIECFLKDTKTPLSKISFIANHGQTLWHDPRGLTGVASTLQLGDASRISYHFNKTVVYDFRSLDVAAGGEGAPLVPIVDYLLFKQYAPCILLNIGGISNITYVEGEDFDKVFAFDTGPGNMILDRLMQILYHKSFDLDATIASKGQISKQLLAYLEDDAYYKQPLPKSTGREKYNGAFVETLLQKAKELKVSNQDLIRTVTYFTPYIIAKQIKALIPTFNGQIIASGGGTKNPLMMQDFKDLGYQITTSSMYNIDPDAKEAYAFSILGYLRLTNQISNVKGATGAKDNLSLGSVIYPPVVK